MKRLRPLKVFTSDQKFNALLAMILVVFSFSSFADDELSKSDKEKKENLSASQFQTKRCDAGDENWQTSLKELLDACSTAGLLKNKKRTDKSKRDTCARNLNECNKKRKKKPSFCLSDAITKEENKERLKDKKEEAEKLAEQRAELQEELQEVQNAILQARNSVEEANAELQQATANLDLARADEQLKLAEEFEQNTEAIATAKDEIRVAQLELSQFVLTNESRCREEAKEDQDRYLEIERGKIRSGRATINQGQLFNNAGLSLVELAGLRYDRILRNCTSLRNRRGRKTRFGSAYLQQKKIIDQRKSISVRRISNLNRQRTLLKRRMRQTLKSLNDQQRIAISTRQRAIKAANDQQVVLVNRAAELQSQIAFLDDGPQKGSIQFANFAVSQEQIELVQTLAGKRQKNPDKKDKTKVAKKSKIEAFELVDGLLGVEEAAKNARDRKCSENGDDNRAESITDTLKTLTGEKEEPNSIATPQDKTKTTTNKKKRSNAVSIPTPRPGRAIPTPRPGRATPTPRPTTKPKRKRVRTINI